MSSVTVKWRRKDGKGEATGGLTTRPPDSMENGIPVLVVDYEPALTGRSPELAGVKLRCIYPAKPDPALRQAAIDAGFQFEA